MIHIHTILFAIQSVFDEVRVQLLHHAQAQLLLQQFLLVFGLREFELVLLCVCCYVFCHQVFQLVSVF